MDAIEAKRKAFWDWMVQNKFQLHPNVRLEYAGKEFGFVVKAAGPIKFGKTLALGKRVDFGHILLTGRLVSCGFIFGQSGQTLFQIPKGLELSFDTSTLSSMLSEEDAETVRVDHDGWTGLILALMFENSKSDSKWRPYLDILPEKLNSPLFWTEDELKWLKGTTIEDTIGLDEVEAHFKEVIQPIFKKYPKVFGDIEAKFCNFEQHKRMGSLIMAYSFSDPTTGTIAMMPMADMLNHVTGENNARLYFPSEDDEDSSDELAGKAKLAFASNKKSKKGESNYDEDSLKMKTISPIKSGDELYNTYGDLSSSELLRKYGFVEPELSEFDRVDVDMQTIAAAAEEFLKEKAPALAGLLADRLQKIYASEEFTEEDAFLLTHEEEPIVPTELDHLARLLLCSSEAWEKYSEEYATLQAETKKYVEEHQFDEDCCGEAGCEHDHEGEHEVDHDEERGEAKGKRKREDDAVGEGEGDEDDEDFGEDDMVDAWEHPEPEVDDEELVKGLLLHILDARAKKFDTTVEEDEALLRDEEEKIANSADKAPTHFKMALVARLKEKKLIEDSKDFVVNPPETAYGDLEGEEGFEDADEGAEAFGDK